MAEGAPGPESILSGIIEPDRTVTRVSTFFPKPRRAANDNGAPFRVVAWRMVTYLVIALVLAGIIWALTR